MEKIAQVNTKSKEYCPRIEKSGDLKKSKFKDPVIVNFTSKPCKHCAKFTGEQLTDLLYCTDSTLHSTVK